jgi:hypothetical protein
MIFGWYLISVGDTLLLGDSSVASAAFFCFPAFLLTLILGRLFWILYVS